MGHKGLSVRTESDLIRSNHFPQLTKPNACPRLSLVVFRACRELHSFVAMLICSSSSHHKGLQPTVSPLDQAAARAASSASDCDGMLSLACMLTAEALRNTRRVECETLCLSHDHTHTRSHMKQGFQSHTRIAVKTFDLSFLFKQPRWNQMARGDPYHY